MIRAAGLAAAALALVAGCAAGDAGERGQERIGTTAQAIVNGEDSDASQDSVVLLVRYDPSLPGGMASDCSGTLLSERIVLTARHCVSLTEPDAACTQQGTAAAGGKVLEELQARSIIAFTGSTRPNILDGAEGAVRAQEIVTNGATEICDNDIALLVLEKPIPNASIAPVRLAGTATKKEMTTVVGWGVTENGPQPSTRKQRKLVEVEDVGPAPQLGPREILVGEGSCSGDSGGPLFAESSGAVIGVLSRGGNGIDRVVPAACLGAVNVYTSSGAHADLIRAAFAKTGETIWVEGERDPRLPPEPPPEEDSCAVSAPRNGTRGATGSATAALVATVALALVRRRRRAVVVE